VPRLHDKRQLLRAISHFTTPPAAHGGSLSFYLGRLTPVQRQAIALAYFRGQSQSEIAHTLDAPVGTVKSWISRGLGSMRTMIDGAAYAAWLLILPVYSGLRGYKNHVLWNMSVAPDSLSACRALRPLFAFVTATQPRRLAERPLLQGLFIDLTRRLDA
jgi:hypothetical protein